MILNTEKIYKYNVEVANNKKWVVKDANEAMESMINKGCRLLNGFYYNPETKIMELVVEQ
jgi:hypothetical protein